MRRTKKENRKLFPQLNTSKLYGPTNIKSNSIIIQAQGDPGENASNTNNRSIIHEYFEYDIPVEVNSFSENNNKEGGDAQGSWKRIFEDHFQPRIGN